MTTLNDLFTAANDARGPRYTALLKADVAIAQHVGPLPTGWAERRWALARELRTAQVEYKAAWEKCKRNYR